ncbi:rhodanese-like domain-containing protein [Marispirochaeta aestuarii]|uniref:rhodanese-like domain-containing protein n=1 Tax=Marispirochaeta aestuarii TaxID=1963862 RepID=UPI0029C85B55|nr:rhodanese-like domain-containing protein [Marispirochaeta aestuarii]
MIKKTTIILLTLMLALSIVSCGKSGADAGLTGTEEITMENIDQYIEKDARFIDLRNFADMFNGGYIAGFEVVPFFQYLEGRALVRNNGWEFSEADVVEPAILENIFGSKEDVIVLMCGSGTRAGYVKDALNSLGYTKVINAGGIRDYKGENKVLGDGSYAGQMVLPAEVTMENIDQYLYRDGAKYVDLRNVADKYVGGYIDSFELVSFFEYLENNALVRNNGWEFSEADVVEPAILENIFGSKDREVFLMCGSGTRAGYVKDALESIGYTNVYNVGGIRDYKGDHKIFGDESFSLNLQ